MEEFRNIEPEIFSTVYENLNISEEKKMHDVEKKKEKYDLLIKSQKWAKE